MKKVLLFIVIILFMSCGITKNSTHSCKLIEKGQKCLPDHSCCKK
jgi:hypothetical protein